MIGWIIGGGIALFYIFFGAILAIALGSANARSRKRDEQAEPRIPPARDDEAM